MGTCQFIIVMIIISHYCCNHYFYDIHLQTDVYLGIDFWIYHLGLNALCLSFQTITPIGYFASIFDDQFVLMQVEIQDEDSGRKKSFTVTIKWAADVAIRPLLDFVMYSPVHQTSLTCSRQPYCVFKIFCVQIKHQLWICYIYENSNLQFPLASNFTDLLKTTLLCIQDFLPTDQPSIIYMLYVIYI